MTIFDATNRWVFAAAAPEWTYWMAPLLFVSTLLLAVAVAVGYYRRVAVPGYRMREQRWRETISDAPQRRQINQRRQR